MKKRIVSTLLLLGSLAFIACGAADTNNGKNTGNNKIEPITETDNIVMDTGTFEQKPAETVNISEATSQSEDTHEYALANESNLEVRFNEDYSKAIIVDGDKEIPFSLNDFAPEVIGAYKMDINNDKKEEYSIAICEGRGTGIYQTGLIIVEEGKEEPVLYISASDIIKEIESRITYNFYEDYKILSIDIGEKAPTEVCLKQYEENFESTYESAFWGDVEYIENMNGEFWINGPIGLMFKDMVSPQYDASIYLSAPLLLGEDNNYSIGNLSIKVSDYFSPNKLESYGEVISSFEADITHDGLKDKLLLVSPESATLDDVNRGIEPGLFYLLEGYGDNSFSDQYSLYREYSGTHVGNGQMFITTINGKDYLIETSFWSGQGTFSYFYEVFFEDCKAKYSVDSQSLIFEQCEQPGDTSEFFENLNKWINDSTYILYAADIDYEPDLQYSTEINKLSPKEYLLYKSTYKWE